MAVEARVAVLPEKPGPLRIEEVRLPDPGPHQVLVRQHASGICHSQLHQIREPRQSDVVLGHESTGTVLEVGGEVASFRPGERVMVTWLPRVLDPDRRPEAASVRLADGRTAHSQMVFTWADHTLADELFLVRLPDEAPTDVTAIIGCAVMTGAGAVINTADVREGRSVAVFGVGGVGLAAVAAAHVRGARPIVAVDLDDAKLEFAKRHGATHGVNASAGDAVERIHELTRDPERADLMGQPISGVDYAFDCIGAPETARQIVPSLRGQALGSNLASTGVFVGIPRGTFEMSPGELILHEKRLVGSLGGSSHPERDFPEYLDWHARGLLDLDGLVSRRFALDEINEAVEALEAGRIEGRAILEF